MDISVIVTAHDEGVIAYYSLKSALRAIEKAQQVGISCELLILLDCVDEETLSVFSQCKSNDTIKIFTVSFSDFSQSKNFGVQQAKGKYVTFLRANDLMSQNWLMHSFDLLENFNGEAVVHPALEVNFGRYRSIEENFATNELMDFALLSGNAYSNMCFTQKSIFLKFPYVSEDEFTDPYWEFNANITKSKILHIIAKETLIYHYRQKNKKDIEDIGTEKVLSVKLYENECSMYRHYCQKNVFLYLLFYMKCPVIWWKPSKISCLWPRFINERFFRASYSSYWYNKLFGFPTHKPGWFVDEIISINSVAPMIQSKHYKYQKVINRAFRKCSFVESAYILNMINTFSCSGCGEFVFFIYALFAGGAEKVARKYLNVLLKKSKKVFLVLEHEEKKHLQHGEEYFLIRKNDFCLSNVRLSKAIAYFLNWVGPKVIYACNNSVFYDTLLYYGKYISMKVRCSVYLNAFAFSFTKDTRERYWITTNIGMISPYISKILVDNQNFKKELEHVYGIEPNKIICNYTQCPLKEFVPAFVENASLNVFWASRICREKRLDVLLKIVEACNLLPIIFHVFGKQDGGYKDKSYSKLKRCSNVKIYGAYNDFASIVDKNFDVFVYTSESDGIPNVLLEAMSFGYPVIAPDVGGIKDLVNNDNGFLIDNYLDYEQYTEILKNIISNKMALKKKQPYIREMLDSKFCEKGFEKNGKKLFYIFEKDV